MRTNYYALARRTVTVDAGHLEGPVELWRHSIGHGAVNSQPLPPRVSQGLKKLKPKLVRVFLQEYFNVYPDHGVFDWSKLDPYMDSFVDCGAQVIATINFKPPVLYPTIDQNVWEPNNVLEYQELIYQVVKRYSVDKPIVTHWEHANETDQGEDGGCPFYMPDAESNFQFYTMILDPILRAFPEARVGGPAIAHCERPMLRDFIRLCHKNKTRLDFVSWHCYNSVPENFQTQVQQVRELLGCYQENPPELMLDELNTGFDSDDQVGQGWASLVSVDEMSRDPKRSAFLAANLLGLLESGVAWTHYFSLWDNCLFPQEFNSFYSQTGIRDVMYRHWNEAGHRFGLFSESLVVRPQYFVYWMLSKMGHQKLKSLVEDPDLKALATEGGGNLSVLVVNFNKQTGQDKVVTIRWRGLIPGHRKLTLWRIDAEGRWDSASLEMIPVESRMVSTLEEFSYQFHSPENSVTIMMLEPS